MQKLNITLESETREPKSNQKIIFGIVVGLFGVFYIALYIISMVYEIQNESSEN